MLTANNGFAKIENVYISVKWKILVGRATRFELATFNTRIEISQCSLHNIDDLFLEAEFWQRKLSERRKMTKLT